MEPSSDKAVTIRVLVVCASPIVRIGLRQLFGSTNDTALVAELGDPGPLEQIILSRDIDLVVVDSLSLRGSQVELIRSTLASQARWPVLVMATQGNVHALAQLFRGNAKGYVAKESEPHVLLAAVRHVAAGERFIDPILVESMFFGEPLQEDALTLLSRREFEVLQQLTQGRSLSQIASSLDLSVKTVSTHKTRLMNKLNLASNADLVRFALKAGIGLA